MESKYQELAQALLAGKEVWRLTGLSGQACGQVEQHITTQGEKPCIEGVDADRSLPCIAQVGADCFLVEHLTSEKSLLICGAGHISVPVAQLGHMLGYRVIVVDDRPEFADPARFPDAKEVLCMDFALLSGMNWNALGDLSVAIVTRGHAADLICLRECMKHDLMYVGMIGSRRKNQAIFDCLRAEGVSQHALAQVHAPIGLAIGAETPEEIAVSIAAELIDTRRTCANSGLPREICTALVHGCGGVMATVARKQGSAPRGIGARLLVTKQGQVLGTIGGGLAEGEVIAAARAMLDVPRTILRRFDMSNGEAGKSGLICGGQIDVLFEGVD